LEDEVVDIPTNEITLIKTDLQAEDDIIANKESKAMAKCMDRETDVATAPQDQETSMNVEDLNQVSPLQQPDLVASIKERPIDLPGVQSFNLGTHYISTGIICV